MRRRTRLLLPLLLLLLAGCTSAKQVYTPDGRQGYTIDCSAYRLTWSACFERASDLCGARGYDILTSVGEPGAQIAGSPQFVGGSTTMNRSMVIACKGP